jgi:hypothetical protein
MKENKDAIFKMQRKVQHMEEVILHLMEKVDVLERKAEGKPPRAHARGEVDGDVLGPATDDAVSREG